MTTDSGNDAARLPRTRRQPCRRAAVARQAVASSGGFQRTSPNDEAGHIGPARVKGAC